MAAEIESIMQQMTKERIMMLQAFLVHMSQSMATSYIQIPIRSIAAFTCAHNMCFQAKPVWKADRMKAWYVGIKYANMPVYQPRPDCRHIRTYGSDESRRRLKSDIRIIRKALKATMGAELRHVNHPTEGKNEEVLYYVLCLTVHMLADNLQISVTTFEYLCV